MNVITLTPDQEKAMTAIMTFLTDPVERVFVLKGYSGTGKTTLVTTLLDALPNLMKAAKLLNPSIKEYEVELTATTNKAAENFGYITGQPVATIHSCLGLRVETNPKDKTSKLIASKSSPLYNKILFIDEASYVDSQLLDHIFKLTQDCKIIFMGDPAQLTPIKSKGVPVFEAKFSGAMLSEVVRNTGPILELSTKFRHTVTSGEFFQFVPDGNAIQYLDRDTFNQAALVEFARPEWKFQDSKILAWTNKTVERYNHYIRDKVLGSPHFQIGDYAICNKFVTIGRTSIRTDQMVHITGIIEGVTEHGVPGRGYELDHRFYTFAPNSLEDWKRRMKQARDEDHWGLMNTLENSWIDLRAAYSCTVNKAQGSTFDKVFIDLDDISRCNSGEQIARMLYVAVSRARTQVILTGDIC